MMQSRDHVRVRATAASESTRASHELHVVTPYRLDLTVTALRRLSTNVVDLLTPEGHYLRALGGVRSGVIVDVVQQRADSLRVTLDGAAGEHAGALVLVRRMLGVDRDLSQFNRAAARMEWLEPLALRMRGLKPPRYPTLWEAFVNTIAFQQVSLQAASAITRRLIIACGSPVERGGVTLYAFPRVEQVLRAKRSVLRTVGFSARKLATLERVAEMLAAGTLDEAMLERQSSVDAAATLQRIRGIGAWTAAVILLRGLGRLDVFPLRDTSVARNLSLVGGGVPLDLT
ncbi:MAG: DNA-3-methyladenine glycosylase family protein, partial [Gemmatimonadaceae bacterium]